MKKISLRAQIAGLLMVPLVPFVDFHILKIFNISIQNHLSLHFVDYFFSNFLSGFLVFMIAKQNKMFNVIFFSTACIIVDLAIQYVFDQSPCLKTFLKMVEKGIPPWFLSLTFWLIVPEVILGALAARYLGRRFSKKAP